MTPRINRLRQALQMTQARKKVAARANALRVFRMLLLATVFTQAQLTGNFAALAQAVAVGGATAQDQRSRSLTLPLAVEIALRTNPVVRATHAGREMADAQLNEAQAGRLPFIQLGETFAHGNNPVFVFGSLLEQGRFGPRNFDPQFLNNPDALSNFRTAVTFRLPILDQKQSSARINQAQIGQRQADKQKDLVEQQVRFEVLRAYYGLIVATANKRVSDEAVRMAEADINRIREKFDAGVVVQSDLLAAEVQLAEYRQQQIQTEGEIVIAEATLNTALGISVDTPQQVADELVEKRFIVPDQQELIRLAIANRPEFARAGLTLKAAEERVRAVRGESTPRLDVFGTFGLSSHGITKGSSDYTVGASLTFNIFDAGRKARMEQARIAEALAATEQEGLANQIRFEVIRAYRQYVSARERIILATRSEEQAKETLRIIHIRYREGLTTITEMLRAETALVRAQMNLIAARYDHYVGFANVLLATGRLTDVQPFGS
jgi:outer membrane protein TolC